jgi:hypothetical protein
MVKYYNLLLFTTFFRFFFEFVYTIINFNSLALQRECRPNNPGWEAGQVWRFIDLVIYGPVTRYLPTFVILWILNERKDQGDH